MAITFARIDRDNGFSTIGSLTLANLFDSFQHDRLETRPIPKDGARPFQRLPHKKRDWKIFLIHSIFKGGTLPPIFLYEDEDDRTILNIVDGQQRLSAIFEFMSGELKLTNAGMLKSSNEELPEELEGKTWDKLTPDLKSLFKKRVLRVEVINNEDHDPDFYIKIREAFHALNITSGGMTSMEIWNNTFYGDFVNLLYNIREKLGFVGLKARELSVSKESLQGYSLLEDRVVSKTEVLRMQDLDLILSLMVAMIKKGPQHKDDFINELCTENKVMDKKTSDLLCRNFIINHDIIRKIGNAMPTICFSDTELHKKHDYYSLFCAVDTLRRNGSLSASDSLVTIGHNVETFNTILRSYIEHVQGLKKTVPEWLEVDKKGQETGGGLYHTIGTKLRKDVVEYYNSRTRDWNHGPNREIRCALLMDILQRSNKIII